MISMVIEICCFVLSDSITSPLIRSYRGGRVCDADFTLWSQLIVCSIAITHPTQAPPHCRRQAMKLPVPHTEEHVCLEPSFF